MPTLRDLHECFADLERAAPVDVDPTLIARRRSRLPAVLAAAVIVAIVVAGVALSNSRREVGHGGPATSLPTSTRPSPTRSSSPAPALSRWVTHTFTVDVASPMTVEYTLAARDHRTADIRGAGGTTLATAIVYPTGGAVPQRPADASVVTVHGHAGFAGRIPATRPGLTAASDGPGLWAVAWQYAPHAWAVVQDVSGSAGVAGRTLRLARAVRTAPTRVVRVPMRLGYLPAGYGLVGVATGSGDGLRTSALSFVGARRVGFTVEVDLGTAGGQPAGHRLGVPITIAGWTGRYEARCGSLWLDRGSTSLSVSTEEFLDANTCRPADGATVPTRTELDRLVRELRVVAGASDPATWIPVTDALPH